MLPPRSSFSEPALHVCGWASILVQEHALRYINIAVSFCSYFHMHVYGNFDCLKNAVSPFWCVYTLLSIGTAFSPSLIYTLCRRLLIMATMCDRSKLFIITSMNSSSFLAPSTNSSRESSPVSDRQKASESSQSTFEQEKEYSNFRDHLLYMHCYKAPRGLRESF